jgi:tetratricopeptide (TPR) repeat protein
MKYYITIFSILLCAFMSPFLLADQSDPRLDTLFQELKSTNNQRMAQLISEDIWNIWSRHNNKKVDELFTLGETAMNNGDFESALSHFNQVIKLAPDFSEAWNKRATTYYQAGQYEASLADIEETLRLEPRHFGALTGRGLCYMKQDKWQTALPAFDQALNINPWLVRVRKNIKILNKMLNQAI